MKKYKNLYVLSAYNLGFLGAWREGETGVNGHYTIVTDLKEFVIRKFGTYANFTSITPDNQEVLLKENGIRVVNDYLVKECGKYACEGATDIADEMWDNVYGDTRISMESLWKTEKHYPYIPNRISANIQQGDKVKNLKDGEVFVCTYEHDMQYMNRNFMYMLVDRPSLHPLPMNINEFKKLYDKAENPLSNWKSEPVVLKPKDPNRNFKNVFLIDGKQCTTYTVYNKNTTTYVIDYEGVKYYKKSNISRPMYDAIEYLIGLVHNEYIDGSPHKYTFKDVQLIDAHYDHESKLYHKFTETESYALNTRATYL